MVTPVAKTGLHCGDQAEALALADEVVTPVAKTGLHCGLAVAGGWGRQMIRVTPVAKTGLHCGPKPVVEDPSRPLYE